MRKVILASSSPRRRELMNLAEIKYSLCIKSVDETVPEGMEAPQAAEHTAEAKAEAVAEINEDAIVVGADTIVVLDGKIMGKPKDEDDAVRMLLSLSGRQHEVITGVCLAIGKHRRKFHVTSKVEFYEITEEEAKHYVKTGEPMDKAGAYGIQGKGCLFVKSIEGDYFNIVGLPIAKVAREIRILQGE